MGKLEIAEILKSKILEVESSKIDNDPKQKIVTVHLNADVFLKMAYLFVGINGN